MRAFTVVEVGLDGRGRSVVSAVRCEAPLLVRTDGAGDGLTVVLVGGAAGPLGGDELEFVMRVGDGASVTVRSVAAMLAQPGPHGGPSAMRTLIEVGSRATLDWETQPIISVAGSDHHAGTRLLVADGATVRFAEAVLLGRHDEVPGRLAVRQRLEVCGGVVLDHEVVLGTGGPVGPGAHGDVRWMQSEIVVGARAAEVASTEVGPDLVSGVFPLAAGVSLSTRVGRDAAAMLV